MIIKIALGCPHRAMNMSTLKVNINDEWVLSLDVIFNDESTGNGDEIDIQL